MTRASIKLKVASPCDASWESMSGDEAKRFCQSCKKDVYQLSNMSQQAVEELLAGQRKGLRICGRFYQRADGTLITSDCSVGVAKKRKRRVLQSVGAAAIAVSAFGVNHAMQARSISSSAGEDKTVTEATEVDPYLGPIHISIPDVQIVEPEIEVYAKMGEVSVFDESDENDEKEASE